MGYQLVGQKIWRVKWLPGLQDGHHLYCIAGSYDDRRSSNALSLWSCTAPSFNQRSRWTSSLKRSLESKLTSCEYEIDLLMESSSRHDGDVRDLTILGGKKIITASSLGCLHLFDTSDGSLDLGCLVKRASSHPIHRFPGNLDASSSIVAIDQLTDSHQIVSIGEEGSLIVSQLGDAQILTLSRIDEADVMMPTCLARLAVGMCISGNSVGGLKLWDTRLDSRNSPSLSFHEFKNVGLNAITHPKSGHSLRIATARRDGAISVWDLRNITTPTARTMPPIHRKDDVWHIMYHGSDQIITSGEDGYIYVLDESVMTDTLIDLPSRSDLILCSYGNDHHPLSINHFDVHLDVPLLIACADTEALLIHPFFSIKTI
jgi:hypothetical protein